MTSSSTSNNFEAQFERELGKYKVVRSSTDYMGKSKSQFDNTPASKNVQKKKEEKETKPVVTSTKQQSTSSSSSNTVASNKPAVVNGNGNFWDQLSAYLESKGVSQTDTDKMIRKVKTIKKHGLE